MTEHNILVTGGAGYLGSILVPELLRAGNRVTVLDNFTYRQNSLAHICNDPKFQIVKGDVRVKSILMPLIKESEIIIPLAALVGAPLCDRDPINAKTINYDSILDMLDLVQKNHQFMYKEAPIIDNVQRAINLSQLYSSGTGIVMVTLVCTLTAERHCQVTSV